MNGILPDPFRLVLWILGVLLAVMGVINPLAAWQSPTDDWWTFVSLFVSTAVCLGIAAGSQRSSSRPDKSN